MSWGRTRPIKAKRTSVRALEARIERLLRERSRNAAAFKQVVATCEAANADHREFQRAARKSNSKLIKKIRDLECQIAFDAGFDTGHDEAVQEEMHRHGECDCAEHESAIIVRADPIPASEVERLAAEAGK